MARKTSDYYKSNRGARRRRLTQQKRYNKSAKGLKIRTAANKLNRQLGTYVTEADAQKAETHLIHEPGEDRYKIVGPPAPKKVSKKKANVKKESD